MELNIVLPCLRRGGRAAFPPPSHRNFTIRENCRSRPRVRPATSTETTPEIGRPGPDLGRSYASDLDGRYLTVKKPNIEDSCGGQ